RVGAAVRRAAGFARMPQPRIAACRRAAGQPGRVSYRVRDLPPCLEDVIGSLRTERGPLWLAGTAARSPRDAERAPDAKQYEPVWVCRAVADVSYGPSV